MAASHEGRCERHASGKDASVTPWQPLPTAAAAAAAAAHLLPHVLAPAVLHGQARAEPPYAEGRLIVLLKPQTAAAARVAGSSALPSGLCLERALNGATPAAANTAAAAGAAVASAAQAGMALLVTITDGASVADKLRQLRANKGEFCQHAHACPVPLFLHAVPLLQRGLRACIPACRPCVCQPSFLPSRPMQRWQQLRPTTRYRAAAQRSSVACTARWPAPAAEPGRTTGVAAEAAAIPAPSPTTRCSHSSGTGRR